MADGQAASLVHVYVFFFFFDLGWILDFARHANGFVFMRNLCVEVKMGVCVQEKCLAGFFSFLLLFQEISLLRHIIRSLYKNFIFLFFWLLQCFKWQVPTLSIFFSFVFFIAIFLWIRFIFNHTFKKFISKWYSIDVALAYYSQWLPPPSPLYTQKWTKIQHKAYI